NISNVTLHSTNLQFWKPGMKINLESSLKVGDPLHGHMVQGHVDGIGTVSSIARVAGSYILEISYPPSMAKYISRKGSISLDGVSLTVNSTENTSLKVNIVPYTWQNTSLQYREIGDKMNIETDLVARYLETLLQQRNATE
ncbi:riboflavin synthase, partial [Anaplasma bovis]|uniref:riboflavin synthase n=1 Tax=Anaplasma bovis TaxID=186733 RepID=UPI002FF05A47